MNRPGGVGEPLAEPTRLMSEGWHCLHVFYRVRPLQPGALPAGDGRELASVLDREGPQAPERLQVSVVSGHRADLGLMMMDPDPLKIDAVLHAVRTSWVGAYLEPAYSFVSISEVSEYVPTVEQYAARLEREGTLPDEPAYAAKVKAYEQRLPVMNKQRLYPDFPEWPVTCFYPMNKIRDPQANWYREPFSRRAELMAEHATSGIKFAGRVSQLITASTGFDDWEWGVTLWARNPESIKEIVYTMRFDEASARYAQFGPFYISYVMPIADALEHLRLD